MAELHDELKNAWAHTVVPVLRGRGYRGSTPTWTLTNDQGDAVVVNLQLSTWNSRDDIHFYVNLAVVPEPWREWEALRMGTPPRKAPREQDGLWRDRLEPSGSDHEHRWRVHDNRSADAAAADVAALLQAGILDRLEAMLDRAHLLEVIRHGSLGMFPRDMNAWYLMGEVVILAQDGPSTELERAVEALFEDNPDEPTNEHWVAQREMLVRWAHDRAARPPHPRTHP